jgi:hypothetical protein
MRDEKVTVVRAIKNPQILIKQEPLETVDIEIRLGGDPARA